MVKSVEPDEFLSGGANGVIVDVRTPAEFESGHIVGAVNIPLFSNQERAEVGTLYVQVGRDQAVEKGLEFVGMRLAELVREAKRVAQGQDIYLYCWRGGMRSASVAWLFSTAGLNVKLLKGGYKAYRHAFDQMLEQPWKLIILSGATGCGKTELLQYIAKSGEQMLDLEGIAHHKGSVFGGFGQEPQPTTEHFINLLHHKMREFDPTRRVWCEGESMLIGHVFLPQQLYNIMRRSPIIEINMETEERLDRLCLEYGEFSLEMLRNAFGKISKRSGTEQTTAALEALGHGDIRTAARIAIQYYDKAYAKSAAIETRNRLATIVAHNDNMKQCATEIVKATK